ncbi:MAG: hypothetical protein ACYTG0_10150 [Planctomycetota bacterium]
MRLNCRDISSEYCQRAKRVTVERLDRYDRQTGQWLEVLAEDRHAGPAETAAARIDVGDWFNRLAPRDREIATSLATGHTTVAALQEVNSRTLPKKVATRLTPTGISVQSTF